MNSIYGIPLGASPLTAFNTSPYKSSHNTGWIDLIQSSVESWRIFLASISAIVRELVINFVMLIVILHHLQMLFELFLLLCMPRPLEAESLRTLRTHHQ